MLTFVSGYTPLPSRLLARFIPPLADGVAAHYLQQHSRPGDLIFDPFGQSPRVALEALALGRRVVTANFNPVSRLALSLAVRPPTEPELRSALTLLADARKEGERLESYVLGLYQTACSSCQTQLSAESFDWDAEDLAEKAYLCPRCGPRREVCDEADRALAQRFVRGSLDYHLLLNRVAAPDDPDRPHAEEALAVYPPRALAAIAALLTKLDTLAAPAEARRLLSGLLIAAFDAACALGQERPKVLAVPRRFREVNLWRALESAMSPLIGVSALNRSMPLPDLLRETRGPAIHAHSGPARDLAPLLPAGGCAVIVSAVPRPNQAYWTLSALWSAWLWGRESAAALRSALRRRRYDWEWHAGALRGTLASVQRNLTPLGRLIGLAAEAEPGFTASLLAAADGAGYPLAGAALRADTGEAQFVWKASAPPTSASPGLSGSLLEAEIKNAGLEGARQTLLARAEVCRWAPLHFGAWTALAEKRLLAAVRSDPVSAVNRLLDPVFRDGANFRRLGADPDDDPATGLWTLADRAGGETVRLVPRQSPLADRVEAEAARLLAGGDRVGEHDLMSAIYLAFPGPHTPEKALVLACLSSYAEEVEPGVWQLRAEDSGEARAREVEEIQAELRALAARHEYDAVGVSPQEWREAGQVIYLFAVIPSAAFSSYVLGRRSQDPLAQSAGHEDARARRRFLVLPGGRSGLAAYKLRRDPRLQAAMQTGNWQMLKFRHVRRMAHDRQLTRATLEPAFAADPLEEARQLSWMAV